MNWEEMSLYLSEILREFMSDDEVIRQLLNAGCSPDNIAELDFDPEDIDKQIEVLHERQVEVIQHLLNGGFSAEQIIYLGYPEEIIRQVINK